MEKVNVEAERFSSEAELFSSELRWKKFSFNIDVDVWLGCFSDDDDNGFYGCWGAYPFTSNNYVYASDMQYGLFVFEFNEIDTGQWSEPSTSS